jgi:hypothetical protein
VLVAHTCNPSYSESKRSGQSKPAPSKQFLKTLSQKTLHKNGAGGVAQGEGPEFKPKYYKKKVP